MSPSRASLQGTWTLRRRLGVAVAAVAVVVLAVVGVSAGLLVGVRHRQHLVTQRYFDAVQRSDAQLTALVDAETAVRGYALTRDEGTLQPLAELRSTAGDTAVVRADLAGDPRSLADLAAARAAARTWYAQWAVPSVARVRAGGTLSTDDVLAGKALFDRLRADYARYDRSVEQRRDEARRELVRRTDLLFDAVLAGAAVALAGCGVLWILLRRWVTAPVGVLAASARAVSAGDLDRRVDVGGPTELMALGMDLEAMRVRLVDQVHRAEATNAALEAARADLERRGEDLERSNRDLEQFAYVASHDLQEPLRKVASFCQLLAKRYSGQLDDRADQYIEFAVDGAKRMQQLINDLLAFSRVGRSPLAGDDEAATADLDACLRRALTALAGAVDEAGAEVTSSSLPVVAGHAGLYTQLLQNLVGNAIKFRAPDRPPRVHVSARPVDAEGGAGRTWELTCADNGIGIEPQYADRIFVIFQRLHAKEVYGGTGIGLALCKRIVERSGGTMWLDTRTGADGSAGEGTTIKWTLPGPPGPQPAAVATSGAPARAEEAL